MPCKTKTLKPTRHLLRIKHLEFLAESNRKTIDSQLLLIYSFKDERDVLQAKLNELTGKHHSDLETGRRVFRKMHKGKINHFISRINYN